MACKSRRSKGATVGFSTCFSFLLLHFLVTSYIHGHLSYLHYSFEASLLPIQKFEIPPRLDLARNDEASEKQRAWARVGRERLRTINRREVTSVRLAMITCFSGSRFSFISFECGSVFLVRSARLLQVADRDPMNIALLLYVPAGTFGILMSALSWSRAGPPSQRSWDTRRPLCEAIEC